MDVRKILVPTDFSPGSDAALRWATSLARDAGATLVMLHVEEPAPGYGAEWAVGTPSPSEVAELERRLQSVVPFDENVSCEHRLVLGEPAREIVRLADEERADLIVMGTHGRTGLQRVLMGSCAEYVVRHADCPVLTMRQPQSEAVET